MSVIVIFKQQANENEVIPIVWGFLIIGMERQRVKNSSLVTLHLCKMKALFVLCRSEFVYTEF